jgi:hypothetical protein
MADTVEYKGYVVDVGVSADGWWYFIAKDLQPQSHETGFSSRRNSLKRAKKLIDGWESPVFPNKHTLAITFPPGGGGSGKLISSQEDTKNDES